MKTILTTFTFLLISLAAFTQELSKEAWLEDLEEYKTGLEEKHIDVYNRISKDDFEKEWNAIKNSLEQKFDLEISIELMRLTRKIGDGHTAISFRNLETHHFPFDLQNFEGSWCVIKIIEKYHHLLGQKLVQINGQSIDDVAAKVGEVAQFVENRYSQVIRTAQNLIFSELLFGLKITSEKTEATFTFQDETGKQTTEKMGAVNNGELENEKFSELKISIPGIVHPDNSEENGFWYTPISGTNALYIHFESYPAFEEMLRISEEIVGTIFQNNIRQLVIDLRNNGGGDLYIGLVLANALNMADPVDWKSSVYVLADNVTFSAATSNTALFRELLNAKIVGEPTGSNPTGYQDMDTFKLPNSKLVICYSKRYFRIQETTTQGIQPDVPMKYEWQSFLQGKDNMLEWVVNDTESKN